MPVGTIVAFQVNCRRVVVSARGVTARVIRAILVRMGPDLNDLALVFTDHLDLPGPNGSWDPRSLPSHGGVYALCDARGSLIQTLGAQHLRRSIAARLAPAENDRRSRRVDLRDVVRRIWWRPTHSVFEGKLAYLEISRRLSPDGYRKDLPFGPAWFATIRLADRFPRWRVDSTAFQPGAVDVGPFARRSECGEFVALLEDVFDLCRYHEVLERTPDGEACAYFDMGKCPAPCDGRIPFERYRGMLSASVRFATGGFDERLAALEADMRRSAAARAYARAAGLRATVASARRFIGGWRLRGVTAEHFRYLIVQRGETRSRVKAFVMDRGYVEGLPSTALKSLSAAAPTWIARARARLEDDGSDAAHRSARVWLVSHFLAKGARAPGLFVSSRALTTPDNLVRVVTAKFARRSETKPDNRHNRNLPIDPKR